MNTAPQNFIWEKDKTGIIVISSGLYELSFGFFTRERPDIQLYVNNEVVKTSHADKDYRSKAQANSTEFGTNLHTSGNVTGMTCIDF